MPFRLKEALELGLGELAKHVLQESCCSNR